MKNGNRVNGLRRTGAAFIRIVVRPAIYSIPLRPISIITSVVASAVALYIFAGAAMIMGDCATCSRPIGWFTMAAVFVALMISWASSHAISARRRRRTQVLLLGCAIGIPAVVDIIASSYPNF